MTSVKFVQSLKTLKALVTRNQGYVRCLRPIYAFFVCSTVCIIAVCSAALVPGTDLVKISRSQAFSFVLENSRIMIIYIKKHLS